ncbi:hypothetical protein RQP46_002378 [Phenoliferia psychrophenolica]
MAQHTIPSTLPIIVLPANSILFPSQVLSLQIARPDSIALLKELLRDAEDSPGNKALIVGCAPMRVPDVDGQGGVISTKADVAAGKRKPTQDDIFEYGTAARIIRLERLASSTGYLAVVEGLSRIQLDSFTSNETYHEATITVHPSLPLPSSSLPLLPSLQSASTTLLSALATVSPLAPLTTRRLKAFISGVSPQTAPALVDILAANVPTPMLEFKDKLALLAAVDPAERVELGTEIFGRAGEGLNLKKSIASKVDASLSRRQREFLLLQQLAAIRQELEELAAKDGGSAPGGAAGRKQVKGGEEEEEEEDDLAEVERKVKEKSWTEESRKVATRELKRLKKSPPQGAEHGVIRNYIDWLLAIPWNDATPLPLSQDFVNKARIKLDEDHYGLDKIKKRLLEWLAVLRLQQESWASSQPLPSPTSTAVVLRDPSTPTLSATTTDSAPSPPLPLPSPTSKPRDKGPILLLCGPPGTGKTSIAKSLAEAMGRKFYRISLGGVRDEAEIRGHRRTYVAALPGAIAQALRKTGVNNPVILLDEIDKLGASSTHGDPGAALLEVLDPEQNWCFQDHYLGIPLDLSSVLFIATANSLDTISDPLYDRMEVIELSGYIHSEKVAIARKYLLPKQLAANALPANLLSLSDETLLALVTSYTREAGVRTVERELGAVCRAKAVEYAEARDRAGEDGGDRERDVEKFGYRKEVTVEDLERILGVAKYDPEAMDKENLVGVATGLAYQGSGNGGILHIESTSMPGSGAFHLTGQLGEVISESAQLALAWVKSHAYELGIAPSRTEDVFNHINIHLHLPAGSIRKDGPSAGVAFVVAMVSLMRQLRVKPGVAMTGEITLRGNVTPVGGIKEKVLAAHRAGIRTLLLPYKNEKDVSVDLPSEIKADLTFIYIRTIWEALEGAFGDQLWDGAEGEMLRNRVQDFTESRL